MKKILLLIIVFISIAYVSYIVPHGQQTTADIFGVSKTLCPDGKDIRYDYGAPLKTHSEYYYEGSCAILIKGNEKIYYINIVINEITIVVFISVCILIRQKI